jgi:hypothetical protein
MGIVGNQHRNRARHAQLLIPTAGRLLSAPFRARRGSAFCLGAIVFELIGSPAFVILISGR